MVLTLRDGRTLERHVAHNLGTPDNPMTDQQLEDKFLALASPVLGRTPRRRARRGHAGGCSSSTTSAALFDDGDGAQSKYCGIYSASDRLMLVRWSTSPSAQQRPSRLGARTRGRNALVPAGAMAPIPTTSRGSSRGSPTRAARSSTPPRVISSVRPRRISDRLLDGRRDSIHRRDQVRDRWTRRNRACCRPATADAPCSVRWTASLRRLGTDYIDLLWVHFPDLRHPADEIVRGLDDLARAGKILYAGLSNFPAWMAARAATLAEIARAHPDFGGSAGVQPRRT